MNGTKIGRYDVATTQPEHYLKSISMETDGFEFEIVIEFDRNLPLEKQNILYNRVQDVCDLQTSVSDVKRREHKIIVVTEREDLFALYEIAGVFKSPIAQYNLLDTTPEDLVTYFSD